LASIYDISRNNLSIKVDKDIMIIYPYLVIRLV
jgi:hypothetical protein